MSAWDKLTYVSVLFLGAALLFRLAWLVGCSAHVDLAFGQLQGVDHDGLVALDNRTDTDERHGIAIRLLPSNQESLPIGHVADLVEHVGQGKRDGTGPNLADADSQHAWLGKVDIEHNG